MLEWTGITSSSELFHLARDVERIAELTANIHWLERVQKKIR
jgi:hypothetical protein